MRLDLMLDMVGDPGGRYAIRDSFYATNAYTLSEIVYGDAPPLRRDADKTPPVRFAPNTMPEPSLDRAERHEVAFQGGMMGMMGGGMMSGQRSDTHAMMGGIWSLNGRSEEHTSELQSLMRISYAVFCLKKKNRNEKKN